MTTTQDCAVLLKKETTYRTAVTPDRSFEFVEESFDWEKNVKQGQGLRAGSRVARSNRRVVPTEQGLGDLTIEAISKGMGYLWELALGTGASNVVSGSTYQQNFTLADVLPSATIQKQLVQADGTIDPVTFLGCIVSGWEIDVPNADIATLKTSWDVADITTGTAAATNAYPAADANLFHFKGASIYNGALTEPTTTTLASAASEVASIRSFNLAVNNNLTNDRFNFGGSGRKDKSLAGMPEMSGSIVAEYASTDFRDAMLNETAMCLVVNLEAGSLATGLETLQIVLPEVKFDNELAKTNGTSLINQTMNFAVLDNLSATEPIWVIHRTADTAL